MSVCVVYLASPRSFMIEGHRRYDVLRASLQITRRRFPDLPVFVFHEDYTDEDIQGLPSGIVYETIDFKGFESLYNRALPNSYGYLMMCRFFSGILQAHPLIRSFTHYIRLDDDSYFVEPYITEDQMKILLGHDYVYRALFREAKPQQSLYEFTMKFIRTIVGSSDVLAIERSLVSQKIVRKNGQYTGIAPYNNFHISSLRLWRHPVVAQYIHAIESSQGILRYGWLDANIHAMIVFALSPIVTKDTSAVFYTGFGYRHNHHVCPLGSLDATCDMSIPFYPIDDETSETRESPTEETK